MTIHCLKFTELESSSVQNKVQIPTEPDPWRVCWAIAQPSIQRTPGHLFLPISSLPQFFLTGLAGRSSGDEVRKLVGEGG